jgi:hypothetical protein
MAACINCTMLLLPDLLSCVHHALSKASQYHVMPLHLLPSTKQVCTWVILLGGLGFRPCLV